MAAEGPFRFLDLPAELRNEIYRFAFEGSTVKVPRAGCGLNLYPEFAGKMVANPTGILLANKQIHFESVELFYATTTFVANANFCDRVIQWLQVIGTKLRTAITCVRLWHAASYWYASDAFQRDMDDVMKVFTRDLVKYEIDFNPSLVSYEIWDCRDGTRLFSKSLRQAAEDKGARAAINDSGADMKGFRVWAGSRTEEEDEMLCGCTRRAVAIESFGAPAPEDQRHEQLTTKIQQRLGV